MAKSTIPALALAFLMATCAVGFIGYDRGTEPAYWSNRSVVYAEILRVDDVKLRQSRVTFRALATLTGRFDSARNALLQVDVYYGASVSAIKDPPRRGTRTLIVLHESKEGVVRVSSNFTAYMPNEAAIMEVDNFEDPRVARLISRLSELRAGEKNDKPAK